MADANYGLILQGFLSTKFGITVEKIGRSWFRLPSGALIYVNGSKLLSSQGDRYGWYDLEFKEYQKLIMNLNYYYVVVLDRPELTFIVPPDKLKQIFGEIRIAEDDRWYYKIRKKDNHYILRPSNDQRDTSNIHYVEDFLNKWDQIQDLKEEKSTQRQKAFNNTILVSNKDTQYFLLQVSRSGSEEVLSKGHYERTNWHDTPRDYQHGMVKGGDILLVYFAAQSIKYKMQLKKVYRVDSVSENNLRFNFSEQRELNGISLDQIKNAIKSGRLRKEVFKKVSQQGFNIAKIEKSDFDEVMLLDREILSANIQSCLKSFPDSKDKKFIENARQIHKEFLERFPFDKHPEIIETLKPEDIYQLGNKDSFLTWLQYKMDPLGGVGFRSGEYRQNVLQNLGIFKQLLKIAVDPNRTLDQKVDAEWDQISGFGGDRIIAKKIIYLFNLEKALPIISTDMEEFLTKLQKDYTKGIETSLGKNYSYEQLSVGQKHAHLCRLLLLAKNEFDPSWDNITFNHFFYRCVSSRYRDTDHIDEEPRMKLEDAIQLVQQQLESEPQRLADEQSVITKYGSMFNPNNIHNLTSEDFLSFLIFKNNKHWKNIHRHGKKITADMEKLRSVLRDFLDEAKPVNERLDAALYEGKSYIDGLGRAILTPILLVVYPEKYAVYNSVTEYAMKYFGIFPHFTGSESIGDRYLKINSIIKEIAAKNNLSLWQMDWVWDVGSKVRTDELGDENIQSQRVESVGSSIYLTAYDDTNLKISKQAEMLGWEDRPSKLSVGDYVFVYNKSADRIETCFEIKSLSTNEDPIWHEKTDMPSSNVMYPHRWNAIVRADCLGITNDIIFSFEPFKSDKKNFTMLVKNTYPRSLTEPQYEAFS